MFGSCIEDVNHEIYGDLCSQRILGGSFEEPPLGLHNFVRVLGHASNLNAARRLGNFAFGRLCRQLPASLQAELQRMGSGSDLLSPDKVWLMPPATLSALLAQNYEPMQLLCTSLDGLDVLSTASRNGNSVIVTVINSPKSVASKLILIAAPFSG